MGGGLSASYYKGTFELIGKIGVGFGGGAGFDPDGRPSRHSQSCGSGYILRTNTSAQFGAGIGPFGAAGSWAAISGNAVTNPEGGGGYTEASAPQFTAELETPHIFRFGASAGVEAGSYTNW